MAAGLAQAASQGFDWFGTIAAFATSGVAAFGGAYFAFQFEKSQRTTEIEDANVAAGNLALFTLSEIWNVLRDYQKQVVNDWRGKADAWLNLPANMPAGYDEVSINVAELAFLLEKEPARVQGALLEQRRFELAIAMITEHSRMVRSEVFPKLTAASVRLNEGRPAAQLEEILGDGIVRQLKVLTDGIVHNVDEDVKSSRVAFDQLRTALKAIYPKRMFFNLPAEAPATDREKKAASG